MLLANKEKQGKGTADHLMPLGDWLNIRIDKKKIDKSIDFLRGGEKKIVSIFRLRRCGKVGLSWDLNEAGPEIYT